MNDDRDIRTMLERHWKAVQEYAQENMRRERQLQFEAKALLAVIVLESIAFMLYILYHG